MRSSSGRQIGLSTRPTTKTSATFFSMLVALPFELEDEPHALVVIHAVAGLRDIADDGARVLIADWRTAEQHDARAALDASDRVRLGRAALLEDVSNAAVPIALAVIRA